MVSTDTNLMAESLSDDVLLERFAKRNSQEAFALLVDRYAGLVFATCRRRLNNADLAEDASQGVFLLLAQNAHRLTAPRTLAPWLYSMSNLVCKGVIRQEVKKQKAEEALRRSEMTGEGEDPALSLVLDAALAKLARSDREAIVMHYLQGLSQLELATALGLTPDATRMRLGRALKRLRGRLMGLGVVVVAERLPAQLSSIQTPVPHGLALKLQAISSTSVVGHTPALLKGSSQMMQISKYSAVIATAAGAGAVFAFHFTKPIPAPTYHVISYAVQPAGADRDPKFVTHKIGEQWVGPLHQRITKYPYYQPGAVTADYLLEEHGKDTSVTVRSKADKVLTMTKDQAIHGTGGLMWAQEPELALVDSDFSKLEHFWKRSIVERLPMRTVTSFGKGYKVIPVQVTEAGFFRVTGYLDVNTGKQVRQETFSKDAKGWYLVSYDEFEYEGSSNKPFDSKGLSTTGQFTLAKPG